MHAQPLAAAEFDLIEETLLKYGDDHSVLNLAELDGYFTALVSSPTQVDIAQWFPAIWGGQNPEWENMEEAQRFLELCVRHINTLAAQLANNAQDFKARFDDTEHQGQIVTLAEEWCFGYIRGAAIGNWPQLPVELAAQLEKSPGAPSRTTSSYPPTWTCRPTNSASARSSRPRGRCTITGSPSAKPRQAPHLWPIIRVRPSATPYHLALTRSLVP